MIEAPEKPFVFNSTNIERHNEVRNEALHGMSILTASSHSSIADLASVLPC